MSGMRQHAQNANCLETDFPRCARDQDDLTRESLRVAMDIWVDEWINTEKVTVLALLLQAGHHN